MNDGIVEEYRVQGGIVLLFHHSNVLYCWYAQRNYYEHIIRNENELNKIRECIKNNPLQRELDIENPERKK